MGEQLPAGSKVAGSSPVWDIRKMTKNTNYHCHKSVRTSVPTMVCIVAFELIVMLLKGF